jgi:hypothetical protein
MSAELYNKLFDSNAQFEGTDALVAAFAREGRLRRAAFELADAEMNEGIYVEEERAPEQAMRYAADDRADTQATFSGEGYTVSVMLSDAGFTVEQTSGPAGASLKVADAWVVLTPGQAVSIPVESLPDTLELVDLTGRTVVLSR